MLFFAGIFDVDFLCVIDFNLLIIPFLGIHVGVAYFWECGLAKQNPILGYILNRSTI